MHLDFNISNQRYIESLTISKRPDLVQNMQMKLLGAQETSIFYAAEIRLVSCIIIIIISHVEVETTVARRVLRTRTHIGRSEYATQTSEKEE